MNSKPQPEQTVMFRDPMEAGAKPIVIELRGIIVHYKEKGETKILRGVPSFKTGKCAIGWIDKATKRVMARPMTLPEHKTWMTLATQRIECQLRSILQITDEKIRMAARPRSWIASLLPLDDSWTWVPELKIQSRLCGPGEEEGATITITRLT
jgi:hypothetical protein